MRCFGSKGKKTQEGREAQLASELTRMKGVVAEITAENLELKKRLRPGRLRAASE